MNGNDREIPDLYLRLSDKLYRNEFHPESENWPTYEAALNDAEAAGLQRNNCLALLVGLRACEEWRERITGKTNTRDRDPWLSQSQFAAEQSRGTVAFEERAWQRFVNSERGINRIQSLIAIGYIHACGTNRIERGHWYPLVPAIEIIMTLKRTKQYDPEKQVVSLMQKRLRRMKEPETGTLPVETARVYFSQVYATLFG